MSNPKPRHDRPTWASRVPREKIARLYATDAQGIVDEELIEDVGIGLFARIESIFKAREASAGRARCPLCDRQIDHDGMKDTILRCESCNWELTWGEYHKAKQGKHLAASGLTVFLQEFLQKYQTARSPKEKMVLIDTLIHRYHWELEGGLTRPGATDLIGGRQHEIIDFLNKLSYGEKSSPEILANRAEWIQKVKKSQQHRKTKREERQKKKEERERKKNLKRKVRQQMLAQRNKSSKS